MALPKYLPVKKKIPYNIRMPENLLDKLNAYADLTGNTTTDVVIDVLNDFMSDKIVFNDYLSTVGSKTIKIPTGKNVKEKLILDEYVLNEFEELPICNEFGDFIGYKEVSTDIIEIKRIPNNLDKFDGHTYKSGNRHQHKGIEFFIRIPEKLCLDFIDYLYCFYFEINGDNIEIFLIDNLKAINLLSDANDITTRDLLISCIKELELITDDAIAIATADGEIINDDYYAEYYSKFSNIVEKYNTGNITKFGTGINERVEINDAENKLNSNPKLIEYLLSRINQLEAHEKSMTELIADLKKDVK